jgi:hypothetical protein
VTVYLVLELWGSTTDIYGEYVHEDEARYEARRARRAYPHARFTVMNTLTPTRSLNDDGSLTRFGEKLLDLVTYERLSRKAYTR